MTSASAYFARRAEQKVGLAAAATHPAAVSAYDRLSRAFGRLNEEPAADQGQAT